MNRTRVRTLTVAAVLALSGSALASTEPTAEEPSTRVFLANDGADCGAGDAPFLTTTARTTDLNCGYIGGGLPFGEVFHQSGAVDNGRLFSNRAATPGFPMVLDADRDVTGVVAVRRGSQQGVPLPGVGQVVADIGLAVRSGRSFVDLGAQSLEAVATGDGALVELAFTYDVPDSLDGVTVDGAEFSLNIRGVHVFHGFMVLNGSTWFDLPTVPAAEEETATEETATEQPSA